MSFFPSLNLRALSLGLADPSLRKEKGVSHQLSVKHTEEKFLPNPDR